MTDTTKPRRGRPPKGGAAMTPAERQQAYRDRLAERGLRVVRSTIRDVSGDEPLTSDVIDLSEVRKPPRS
ncbi:MAG: hypothetical protein ACK57J_22735 [Rubrivivax sp.]